MNNQQSILSFWRDIEIFTLPDLPHDVKLLNPSKPLPWEMPFEKSDTYTWRHVVYLGKHNKAEILTIIEGLVEDNQLQDWSDKPSGNTCMAILIVDENGKISHDSGYLQASYLHGVKCLFNNSDVSRVNEELSKTLEQFRERYPLNQPAESLEEPGIPVLKWADLKNEINVLNKLDIEGIVCHPDIFIRSIKVSRSSKPDPTFLNSFYLDDLNFLLGNTTNFGKGIASFLRDSGNAMPLTDVLQRPESFLDMLDPVYLSAGRWPSDPAFGLSTAQLSAVNVCLSRLRMDNGILGVNGPPGTGKTTLLNDIIADIVTTRAGILVKENVNDLFGKGTNVEKSSGFAWYYPPKSRAFQDSGILVASNNNAAVENISKELPDERKIDRKNFPQADYFSPFCQDLIEGESWGLMAAALGNSQNRLAFKNNFYYNSGKRKGFATMLYEVHNNTEKIDRSAEYLDKYNITKTELTGLFKEFEILKGVMVHFYALLRIYLNDRIRKTKLESQIVSSENALQFVESQKQTLTAQHQKLSLAIQTVQTSISLHQSSRPFLFFFHKLFNTPSFRRWNEPLIIFFRELSSLTTDQGINSKKLTAVQREIEFNELQLQDYKKSLEEILIRQKQYFEEKKHLHQKTGIAYENIPDEGLYDHFIQDRTSFHKCSPWSSLALNILRGKIFLTSLKLHEYAIMTNARQFRNNLNLFMELTDGKSDVSESMAAGLWNSFFFCVPVVSTSLASVSKLLRPLPKESIGWLLLDEAGQATPQSAAGAIFRAQNSIIIGDPLQIEPVVTIPQKLAQILNSPYKTGPEWSPLLTSAQVLADRVTNLGTWMNTGEDDKIWAGLPLRAHRRCDSPMFEIANAIAYCEQMVKVQPDQPFDISLGKSAWFDVQGYTIQNKQVVMEEIDVLVSLVQKIYDVHKEIFVISPFKSVANKCGEVLSHRYPRVRCGTIHTFQGKEAEIVFMVLGSAPDRPASRQWAAQKPNMLNVALTRAKRRFYVIGNKKLWASCSHFSQLALGL